MLIGLDLLGCDDWHRERAIADRVIAVLLPAIGDDLRLLVFEDGTSGLPADVAHPFVEIVRLDRATPDRAEQIDALPVLPSVMFCPTGRIGVDLPAIPVVTAFYGGEELFGQAGRDVLFRPGAGDLIYAAQRAAAMIVPFQRAADFIGASFPFARSKAVVLPPLPLLDGDARAVTEYDEQAPGPPLIVHVGDDTAGVAALIEACRDLQERGVASGVLVAADPSLGDALQADFVELDGFATLLSGKQAVTAAARGASSIILNDMKGTDPFLLGELLHCRRPLISSDRGGLAEWARGRATFYDPARPGALADAFVAQDQHAGVDLPGPPADEPHDSGRDALARRYADVLRAAAQTAATFTDFLGPIYEDGWVGSDLVAACGPGAGPQSLVVRLYHSGEPPSPEVKLVVSASTGRREAHPEFVPASEPVVRVDFGADGGAVRLHFSDLSSPAATNPDEHRLLSLRLLGATVECLGEARVLGAPAAAPDKAWIAFIDRAPGAGSAVLAPLTDDFVESAAIDLMFDDHQASAPEPVWIRSSNGALQYRLARDGGRARADIPLIGPKDLVCWEGRGDVAAVHVQESGRVIEPLTYVSYAIAAAPGYIAGETVPGVSVVMPALDRGDLIGETIESALGQDHLVDLNVIDRGSDDDTLALLAGYGDRLVVTSEPDCERGAAVNRGIELGRGEIVGWLNPGDAYHPGAFAEVVRIFADDPQVDIVYGECDVLNASGHFVSRYPTESFDRERLLERCFIAQPATFVRRSAFAGWDLLRPNLSVCLDYELWLRMATDGARFRRSYHRFARARLDPDSGPLAGSATCRHEIAEMMAQCFGRYSVRATEAFAIEAAIDSGLPRLEHRIRSAAHSFWSRRAKMFGRRNG